MIEFEDDDHFNLSMRLIRPIDTVQSSGSARVGELSPYQEIRSHAMFFFTLVVSTYRSQFLDSIISSCLLASGNVESRLIDSSSGCSDD